MTEKLPEKEVKAFLKNEEYKKLFPFIYSMLENNFKTKNSSSPSYMIKWKK